MGAHCHRVASGWAVCPSTTLPTIHLSKISDLAPPTSSTLPPSGARFPELPQAPLVVLEWPHGYPTTTEHRSVDFPVYFGEQMFLSCGRLEGAHLTDHTRRECGRSQPFPCCHSTVRTHLWDRSPRQLSSPSDADAGPPTRLLPNPGKGCPACPSSCLSSIFSLSSLFSSKASRSLQAVRGSRQEP